MRIEHPVDCADAVALRHGIENSMYLAGCTDALRLNGSASEDSVLIDISGIVPKDIFIKDGKLFIGAGATLEDLASCSLVPRFIRESALFCSSLQHRNAATVGGNIALRRLDSYLIPSLFAADAGLTVMCTKGEKHKGIAEYYAKKGCRAMLLYVVLDEGIEGEAVRFGRTSSTHASLIAARSGDRYCYQASSSGLAYGDRDAYREIAFADDIEGSAEYKRYLASVAFKEA